MFKLSRFLRCLFITCIISTQITDVVLKDLEEHNGSESATEQQRKREQAEKYIQKLKETSEQWVDPYDMLKDSNEKNLDLSSEKTHKVSTVSISNKHAIESDFKPTFSDIRGEVIDGKSVADDDTLLTADHEKDSGKILSDVRQEICVLDSIYITRWLKKLIAKLESYSNSEPSSLSFSVDSDTLDMLQTISESKSLDIGDLDDLICQLISKATVTSHGSIEWESLIPNIMYTLWIAVAVFCALCVVYTFSVCIIHHRKLTLFSIFIIISVFWHWMRLYQEKMAHKHAEMASLTISNQCVQTDMGITEHVSFYLKSIFTRGDCKKYYEAVIVDAIWEVSISVAVSDAIASFVFQPLEVSARAINNGLKYLFQDLSVFAVIPLILFIFVLAVMYCGYMIKFPFFLGSLEPGARTAGSSIEDLNLRKTNKIPRLSLSNPESLNTKLGLDTAVFDANALCRRHSCNLKDTILVKRNDSCQTAECRCKNVETYMIAGDKTVYKILQESDDHSSESSVGCSTELADDFKRVQTGRTEHIVPLVNKVGQCCCMKESIDEVNAEASERGVATPSKSSVVPEMKSKADEKTLPSFDEPKDVCNIPVRTENVCEKCCDKNVTDIYATNEPSTMLIQSPNVASTAEFTSHSLELKKQR